jgi:hypothetical protein
MHRNHALAGAIALACGVAFTFLPAYAATTNYHFEFVGKPETTGHKSIVQVRLVHDVDNMLVSDATITDTHVDMGPGMESMAAPVKSISSSKGIYSFEIDPAMPGTWFLHLTANVQGESVPVRADLQTRLVN